jgi:hypothetical protein
VYLRHGDWREARLAELCHTREGYEGRHDNAGRVTERCGRITSKKTQSRFWSEGRPVKHRTSKSLRGRKVQVLCQAIKITELRTRCAGH